MKTTHTALPWHNYGGIGSVYRADGEPVAEYTSPSDAAFIVRACNSHYELLAALEDLVDCHADYAERDKHEMAAAIDAIFKAKGE